MLFIQVNQCADLTWINPLNNFLLLRSQRIMTKGSHLHSTILETYVVIKIAIILIAAFRKVFSNTKYGVAFAIFFLQWGADC